MKGISVAERASGSQISDRVCVHFTGVMRRHRTAAQMATDINSLSMLSTNHTISPGQLHKKLSDGSSLIQFLT